MKKYLLFTALTCMTLVSFAQDKVEIMSNINKVLIKANNYHNKFFDGTISLQIFDEATSAIASKVTFPNQQKDIFYRLYFWKDAKWKTNPEVVISKNPDDAPEISTVIIRFKTFGDVAMERSNGSKTGRNEMFFYCLDSDAANLKKLTEQFVRKMNE